MTALNAPARDAARAAQVRAATDITGFGLAGHGWEMASASGVCMTFEASQLPLYPEAEAVLADRVRKGELPLTPVWAQGKVDCAPEVPPARRHLFADPQTSGGLLMAVPTARAATLLRDLHARGVGDAALVGRVEATPAPSIRILP